MTRRALLAPLAVLAACASVPATASAAGAQSYIVVLKRGAPAASALAARETGSYGLTVTHVYQRVLQGYAARIPAAALASVKADPNVQYVEPDLPVHAFGTQTEAGATWGLDRIDQHPRTLDGAFHFGATGAGVTAYIIDTGIHVTHTEFGGRAIDGFDAVDGALPADDCNGHGTHVAGTVGGATYGVAKGVTLVAVRVLDCSGNGTISGVIAGIDWVTANHTGGPAVANMSLGGGVSAALDDAVRTSIADGVSYAIAAGNGDASGVAQDACNSSPARVTEAMTIGATDSNDRKASWSNYGSCVDWFAPGVSITSAWATSNTATNTISGTSMATPHTTGVAALYLQSNPLAPPAVVRDALFSQTTKGVVQSSSTTNNDLLYTPY